MYTCFFQRIEVHDNPKIFRIPLQTLLRALNQFDIVITPYQLRQEAATEFIKVSELKIHGIR